MQKLSPEAEKLSNLKMWLTEQIERYEALAARYKDSPTGSMTLETGCVCARIAI